MRSSHPPAVQSAAGMHGRRGNDIAAVAAEIDAGAYPLGCARAAGLVLEPYVTTSASGDDFHIPRNWPVLSLQLTYGALTVLPIDVEHVDAGDRSCCYANVVVRVSLPPSTYLLLVLRGVLEPIGRSRLFAARLKRDNKETLAAEING